MPSICLHLGIAKEAAEKLHHPTVDQNPGSYLLGATAPDVRTISDISREETHFFDLRSERVESGARHLFRAHPDLADAAKLGERTKVFVAGYLCHLLTDEAWIFDIYRPFFGKASPLADDPMVGLVDRALQFELDRRERLNQNSMEVILSQLSNSESGVATFIDAFLLKQWREFVCQIAAREPTEPSWERFRFFAERFYLREQEIEPEQLEAFFTSLPTTLERTIELITPERIKEFRKKSVAESVKATGEYLG